MDAIRIASPSSHPITPLSISPKPTLPTLLSLPTTTPTRISSHLRFNRATVDPLRAVSGGEGGGGGGGTGGGSGGGDEPEEEEEDSKGKKMSMSQKLTLAYAALVGVGGFVGYIKSGSQKSAISGGASALFLYYVYTQLPVRPALASSLGLGLSAALLVVMGSRFKKSGKVFPAGVVSLVSLIMAGGYFHGIFRGMHA